MFCEPVSHSLHAQRVLAHRLPAVLVAAGLLLEEEALGEPKGAVLSLAAGDQHAQREDDQQEGDGDHYQHQLDPLRQVLGQFEDVRLTWRGESGGGSGAVGCRRVTLTLPSLCTHRGLP